MQQNEKLPLIIAHRGASADAPENTLAAFQKAVEAGADGIEFDVRPAKDGVPVVFHDATLRRLAKKDGRVADFTAAELNEINVGSWFNRAFPRRADEKFAAETIPTFEQLLNFLSDYEGTLYVELKGERMIRVLAEAVCDLIVKSAALPRVVVKSFNLEAIKLVKEILPTVRTAALFEPKILTILRRKKLILDEAEKHRADEISLHRSLATKNFVALAHERNFSTVVWTANSTVWVERARNFGINAVITNYPARLLAAREEISKEN